MRTIEQIGKEFFESVDDTLTSGILGIHNQLAAGNAEELASLCNIINDTEDDLYDMARKLSELSDKLMDAGYFDKVVAYKDLSFRMESLIDKLTDFTFKSTISSISVEERSNSLDKLNEEFKRYSQTKKQYNL